MKRKIVVILMALYIIIASLSTILLLNHNTYGAFESKDYYYVCDKNLKDYGRNSLVRFAKNVDLEELINEDVYYYDVDKILNHRDLVSYDKEKQVFKVSEEEYDIKNFLGKPDKEYKFLGYILKFLTTKSFYLAFVIIPFVTLFVYELYKIVVAHFVEKNGKEIDDESKKEKED